MCDSVSLREEHARRTEAIISLQRDLSSALPMGYPSDTDPAFFISAVATSFVLLFLTRKVYQMAAFERQQGDGLESRAREVLGRMRSVELQNEAQQRARQWYFLFFPLGVVGLVAIGLTAAWYFAEFPMDKEVVLTHYLTAIISVVAGIAIPQEWMVTTGYCLAGWGVTLGLALWLPLLTERMRRVDGLYEAEAQVHLVSVSAAQMARTHGVCEPEQYIAEVRLLKENQE